MPEVVLSVAQDGNNFQRRPPPQTTDSSISAFFLEKKFLAIHAVATSILDLLLTYVPVIGDGRCCIQLDKQLIFITLGLRVPLDFLLIIIACINYKDLVKRTKPTVISVPEWKKAFVEAMQPIWQAYSIDVSVYTILFYVVISLLFKDPTGPLQKRRTKILTVMMLCLLMWNHFLKFTRLSLRRAKAHWFFFIFVYSSQLFAALWYLPAIYKENLCWQKAYRNLTGSGHIYDVFNCSSIDSHQRKFISEYCSKDTHNYDFGAYVDVRQSGILENKSLGQRIIYFSRWSLQCLCSFAQDLKPGAEVWDNIFTIFIMMYGMFTFYVLIGYVQADFEGLAKFEQKRRETVEWMKGKVLSKNLKNKVDWYQKFKGKETKVIQATGAHVALLNNLREDLRKKMTHELCINLLKNNEKFGSWSEPSLVELCHRLKPVFFVERTHVIREGDPIDEMILVFQGKLWTYTKSGCPSVDHDHRTSKNEYLKDGDFHGLELVNWFEADRNTSDLPISTITIKAVTDVEAFVLTAHDLKEILISHHVTIRKESSS